MTVSTTTVPATVVGAAVLVLPFRKVASLAAQPTAATTVMVLPSALAAAAGPSAPSVDDVAVNTPAPSVAAPASLVEGVTEATAGADLACLYGSLATTSTDPAASGGSSAATAAGLRVHSSIDVNTFVSRRWR